jgi:hypothetical protein
VSATALTPGRVCTPVEGAKALVNGAARASARSKPKMLERDV